MWPSLPRRGTGGQGKQPGSDLPGLNVKGLGTLSATAPVALSASGRQSGSTVAAIAPGSIAITGGDAVSQATAQSISRDTSATNDGALTREFDEATREEIALGFQAAQTLVGESSKFLTARAKEEKDKLAQADEKDEQARKALKAGDTATAARLEAQADALRSEAEGINRLWGGGGLGNIVLTAVSGAAGANVTGSTVSLVRATTVNVLQSLTTSEVKAIGRTSTPAHCLRDPRERFSPAMWIVTLGQNRLRAWGARATRVTVPRQRQASSASCFQ